MHGGKDKLMMFMNDSLLMTMSLLVFNMLLYMIVKKSTHYPKMSMCML